MYAVDVPIMKGHKNNYLENIDKTERHHTTAMVKSLKFRRHARMVKITDSIDSRQNPNIHL